MARFVCRTGGNPFGFAFWLRILQMVAIPFAFMAINQVSGIINFVRNVGLATTVTTYLIRKTAASGN
jgi:hypothetical protein